MSALAPETLLSVEHLVTVFDTARGRLRAVDDVSLSVSAGRTLGIVGESGCGKSVMSLSIMGLVPTPPGRIESGRILFQGTDLRSLSAERLRALRGKDIAMIFQEPMSSLNPVYTVGEQIMEVFMLHRGQSRTEAKQSAIEMLRRVGISSPEERVDSYPHELSGGMRQRVMIAMAIACEPKLLIADEPTTALDVTVQAQIMALLGKLRSEHGMAIMLITHDLGLLAQFADDVVVMYAGKVVERAPIAALFDAPAHPYTRGLLASRPGMVSNDASNAASAGTKHRLPTIEGMVPDLLKLGAGSFS
jgi:peptide/nickel transport system ATP-binding protein